MDPLVTIGMPTYNRRHGYFPQALQSALAQDYPNLEVVVCDNASTDGTQEYMEAMTDPRLRYVRHAENIGANANFNSCLENADGHFFLMLHDDDLLDPTFVSRCVGRPPPGESFPQWIHEGHSVLVPCGEATEVRLAD